MADRGENLLHRSWNDPAWAGLLNEHNVMDYFMERTNPFYDRQCNNEVLRMQRASQDQLAAMTGVEYQLLFVQPNILFVVRKQARSSPSHVTPIADYYIINGHIYQAPDLSNVLSSRLLTAVTNLQSAFEEARGYAKYHPSRGYWWDFDDGKKTSASLTLRKAGATKEDPDKKKKSRKKKKGKRDGDDDQAAAGGSLNAASSMFQRRRVDMLLDVWVRKFPPNIATAPSGPQPPIGASNPASQVGDKTDDVKSEKDAKSEKPSEHGGASNAGFDSAATARGIKREAGSTIKQENKKQKIN